MTNFQTILTAVFIAFFVLAVLIFSGLIKLDSITGNDKTPQGKVVIWGTFSRTLLADVLNNLGSGNKDLNISYITKDASTYQQDLIEAFANGKGPDLFIITPDMIKKNINFIYKIPYTSYPEKTFRDSFIDGADIYLDKEGVLAYPMIVDPMVLYYNKDILANEGFVSPPEYWDELFPLNSILTKKENSGTINQSMIALGQYNNVNNAKDIIVTLLLQNNNQIVVRSEDSIFTSTINSNPQNLSISPIEAVLRFFLEFSNPSKEAYSWNRSLPNSLDMFTGGKLAFYLGNASELFNIESINPNLSFDVAQIPQVKNSPTKRTLGKIYAMAVNKKSTNITAAFGVAGMLSQGEDAKNFGIAVALPPASRVLLADRPNDPYLFTFFNSAVISRSWFDPDGKKSDVVFKEMIENILSNNLSIGAAVGKAKGQLDILLK